MLQTLLGLRSKNKRRKLKLTLYQKSLIVGVASLSAKPTQLAKQHKLSCNTIKSTLHLNLERKDSKLKLRLS